MGAVVRRDDITRMAREIGLPPEIYAHPGVIELVRRAVAEERKPAHVATIKLTHDYKPHKKYPWFCAHCGYAEHEPLMHTAAAERVERKRIAVQRQDKEAG